MKYSEEFEASTGLNDEERLKDTIDRRGEN